MNRRLFVKSFRVNGSQHLKETVLLPPDCKTITGITVTGFSKTTNENQYEFSTLPFPQMLFTELLNGKQVNNLFFSYLQTRSSVEDSKAFVDTDIKPVILNLIKSNLQYPQYPYVNWHIAVNLDEIFSNYYISFLYDDALLFEMAEEMELQEFTEYFKRKTLEFLYENRASYITFSQWSQNNYKVFEAGNVSLLLNGNDFLFRDFQVTANKKLKPINKEIYPMYQPLEINSSIDVVFKSLKSNPENELKITMYVEYEYK